MTKFYAVCYGETGRVDGHNRLTSQSKEGIRVFANNNKDAFSNIEVVIVSSNTSPALECVEILTEGLKYKHLKDSSLSLPHSRVGKVIKYLEGVIASLTRSQVLIVVTKPENHDSINNWLSSGRKKPSPKALDEPDVSSDIGDDYLYEN